MTVRRVIPGRDGRRDVVVVDWDEEPPAGSGDDSDDPAKSSDSSRFRTPTSSNADAVRPARPPEM